MPLRDGGGRLGCYMLCYTNSTLFRRPERSAPKCSPTAWPASTNIPLPKWHWNWDLTGT